jgi:hypothetical protein
MIYPDLDPTFRLFCNQIRLWAINDRLGHYVVKISKNFAVFNVKKVGSIYESGSGTIIPDLDPTWPKKYLI